MSAVSARVRFQRRREREPGDEEQGEQHHQPATGEGQRSADGFLRPSIGVVRHIHRLLKGLRHKDCR
ncbi:MAG: hypothetical protein R3B90_13980 [Planctomycetaceae bacterium]